MHQALCHNPGNKTEITAKALAFSFPKFIRKLFLFRGFKSLTSKFYWLLNKWNRLLCCVLDQILTSTLCCLQLKVIDPAFSNVGKYNFEASEEKPHCSGVLQWRSDIHYPLETLCHSTDTPTGSCIRIQIDYEISAITECQNSWGSCEGNWKTLSSHTLDIWESRPPEVIVVTLENGNFVVIF